jgi:hypothetical protein
MRSVLPAVFAFAFVAPVAAEVPAAGAGVGTAGPASVAASAQDGSWVLLCQARRDTDHDGNISVRSGFNGTRRRDLDHHHDHTRPALGGRRSSPDYARTSLDRARATLRARRRRRLGLRRTFYGSLIVSG